jgi:uncharacterized protein YprB with RNaseH-like and TPR domain
MSAEEFAERLRRLRRESAAPAAPRAAIPASMRERLARRDERARRRASEEIGTERASLELPADLAESSVDPTAPEMVRAGLPSGLERIESEAGMRLVRRETFARDHLHGEMHLSDVDRADPRAFALLARDRDLEDLDLTDAIYLDTETSGLSGGSGTYVFLVGLGSFDSDGFRLAQAFLDDPARERDLLADCADRIRRAPAIVSFFGKSFDRHRLEDRMRCLGIDPPFEEKAHLDLYHPLRRLYRGAFADHRLRTLESELCGLRRENDLPGSFAPAAWFDFLAGRAHRLEGVFRHNRDDVLSLVTLAAHLGDVLRRDDPRADAARRVSVCRSLNLARALAEAGETSSALGACTESLSRADRVGPWIRALRLLRAELLRRSGDAAGALAELRELAGKDEDEHSVRVLIALARLELRERADAEAARAACARASLAAARRHTGRELARCERDLEHLRARLERLRSRPERTRASTERTRANTERMRVNPELVQAEARAERSRARGEGHSSCSSRRTRSKD